MYIYQTTHISTGKFYIGFSSEGLRVTAKNSDPMNVFRNTHNAYNGVEYISTLRKDILFKTVEYSEVDSILAGLAKAHESNPNFIGIRVKVESKQEKPVESKKPPVSNIDNK